MKGMTNNDELFYVEISDCEISDIRYLKVINNKKCLTAKFIDYSDFKYFFDVEKSRLIDIEYVSKNSFYNKFKNHDIEIIKFKKENDVFWKDHTRSSRDYNWKYEIANGKNKEWVLMKKKLLDEYLEDIREFSKVQKDTRESKEVFKALNKGCDDMLDMLNAPVSFHSTFTRLGVSGYANIEMERSITFFEAMLKGYRGLKNKYEKKSDHQIYHILNNFKNMVDNNKYLTFLERNVVEFIMSKGMNYDLLLVMLNTNFKKSNKPFDRYNIKQMLDYIIPNKLLKQYELSFEKGEHDE